MFIILWLNLCSFLWNVAFHQALVFPLILTSLDVLADIWWKLETEEKVNDCKNKRQNRVMMLKADGNNTNRGRQSLLQHFKFQGKWWSWILYVGKNGFSSIMCLKLCFLSYLFKMCHSRNMSIVADSCSTCLVCSVGWLHCSFTLVNNIKHTYWSNVYP